MNAVQVLKMVQLIGEHMDMYPDQPFNLEVTGYAPSPDGSEAYELSIYGMCSDGQWGLISEEVLKPR